jgi:hypothetical protein
MQTFAQGSEGQDFMRVEISVESVDSVQVDARAGAACVELCAGLSDGGLTRAPCSSRLPPGWPRCTSSYRSGQYYNSGLLSGAVCLRDLGPPAGQGWRMLAVVEDARLKAQDGHAAWSEAYNEMFAQVAGVFGNASVRRRGRWYVLGLLSHAERKNSWWLAEFAGEVSPDGMRRLLNFSPWDEDAARDALARYKFPNPPNKDVGEGLNTALGAMKQLRLANPVIRQTENSLLLEIRHQHLGSLEQIVMDYLDDNDEITNRIARDLSAMTSENTVKDSFKRLASVHSGV